jgi:hypothetical protein
MLSIIERTSGLGQKRCFSASHDDQPMTKDTPLLVVASPFQVDIVVYSMISLPRRVHEGSLRRPPCSPGAGAQNVASAETTQRCFAPDRSVAGHAAHCSAHGPPGRYLGAVGNGCGRALVDAPARWAPGS